MKNSDKSNENEKNKTVSRRNLLKAAAAAAPAMLLTSLVGQASAAPNGTFPTVLSNLSVVSISSTNMKVSGRLTTISGNAVAAMRIDIFSVAAGSFARLSTAYTNGSGNFEVTLPKPPADRKIQISVDGNGTYSQPLPTFNRP